MMKIYCYVCNKYIKFKTPKTSDIFKRTLDLCIVYSKCAIEYSIEILKILEHLIIVISTITITGSVSAFAA